VAGGGTRKAVFAEIRRVVPCTGAVISSVLGSLPFYSNPVANLSDDPIVHGYKFLSGMSLGVRRFTHQCVRDVIVWLDR